MRLRRATENNSLIPAIVEGLNFYPDVFAFQVKAEGGRSQRLVVPKGTADILGVRNYDLRPLFNDLNVFGRAMVSPFGQAFAIETKWSHRPTCKCDSCKAQREWRDRWMKRGGLYILARSPQEAIDGLMGRRAA